MNIAAASIIAKTKRDEIMKKLSISFPEYLWNQNKGYPTKKHKNAISEFGTVKHHRKSFKLT
jgi:ribonuclease HII